MPDRRVEIIEEMTEIVLKQEAIVDNPLYGESGARQFSLLHQIFLNLVEELRLLGYA